jgi:hypothetical protein
MLTRGKSLNIGRKNGPRYHVHLFPKPRYYMRYKLKLRYQKLKLSKLRYLTLINIKTMGISNFYRKIDYVRAERRLRGAFGFLSRMEAGCVVKY